MLTEIKVGVVIYTIVIMISLIIMTAVYTRAKKTATSKYLIACQMAVVLWLFFGIVENLAKNTSYFPFIVTKVCLWLCFLGPLWMMFTLEYLDLPKSRLLKPWRWLLFAPALATVVLSIINPYSDWIILSMDGLQNVQQWGIVIVAEVVYTYVLMIISIGLVIVKSLKSKRQLKENILLFSAALFPVIINMLINFRVIVPPVYDLTPITLSVFMGVVGVLVFRNKLLDIMPFAAHELFTNINEAILIIDLDGMVIEYNQAFQNLFAPYFDVAGCRSLAELSHLLPQSSGNLQNAGPDNLVEFQVTSPDTLPRQITCAFYPFVNAAKKKVGRLLTFQDITDYRQKTLKTERLRLSNDLHDSLGNSLNIISSNLEYSIDHLPDDPVLRECLLQSYSRTTSAFLDLRRIVEELSPVDIENNGLIWALESLFGKLNHRGIEIDFDNCLTDPAVISASNHGEAIYFICQESINNAITHGRARHIQIVLNQNGNTLMLYITDDGVGCSTIIKNKGINSMLLRVDALGGSMTYGSPSEGGFTVKITIPMLPGQPEGATL